MLRPRHVALPLRRALSVAALTAILMAAGLSQAEARRLALVVGNAAYSGAPVLKNAVRDAQDVAATLERLGFEVTLLTDVGVADFWDRVDAFAKDAETAESTLFFYSGHAFQMNGANYLLPVDAALTSREAIRAQTWSLDGIIARLQSRQRQTLIFLDACRNDPLPAAVRGSAAADGLARLQTGVGTFVAFATEPGAVTYDGAGDAPNSPFTTALLKNIETPGLSVSDMMIKVRTEVEETTLRRQIPWDQSSLREQFYFKQATETRQELSEADYELLAQLSPEDRAKFMELLRASGFSEDSLRKADDAITVASYNLEIAREESVSISAVTADTPVLPLEPEIDFDMTELEVVDTGVTVTGTPVLSPEPPLVVAALPDLPVIAAALETRGAALPAQTVPTAPPTSGPSVLANAPPAPAGVKAPAAASGLPGGADAPVVLAGLPARPGLPEPDRPILAGDLGSLPPEVIASLPQEPESPGLGEEIGPAVRVAALTWDTRGVLELAAARVPGSEVTPDDEQGRAVLAAIDPRLLDDTGITIDESPRELARAAQAELARLGCYHMKVDGSWGPGSRTALTSYFLAKRQVPDSLEPTPALIRQLQAEGKVVCEARVARVVVPGKTKAILPAREVAATPGRRNPATGRVIATPEQRKTEIRKGLLGSGSF